MAGEKLTNLNIIVTINAKDIMYIVDDSENPKASKKVLIEQLEAYFGLSFDQKYVDLTNVQLIDGEKTFSEIVNSNTTPAEIDAGTDKTLINKGWVDGKFPNIVTVPPTSSSGAAGDKAGNIAFSSSFFYYCVSDYVAPGTQVWQRIAKDATAW
tara:strand:+ start:203 stop:664 length:462 start_codon:yes stop_codon:yes gene_type:complete